MNHPPVPCKGCLDKLTRSGMSRSEALDRMHADVIAKRKEPKAHAGDLAKQKRPRRSR